MPSRLNAITASAILFFSLATAAPSAQPAIHFPYLTEAAAIEARGASFHDFGDHTGSTSKYNTDTDGSYVKSGDVHKYASGVKCWTDLFYTTNERVAVDWKKSDQEIDCGGSTNPDKNSCVHNEAINVQQCVTHTNGGTVEPGLELSIGFGLQEFAEAKGAVKLGGSYVHLDSKQTCDTTTTTNTCGWGDDACHAVWTSVVSNRVHGFLRRRCNNNDGKGDTTAWSFDLDFDNPTKIVRLGCDAKCDDTSYPGAVPGAN